MLAVVDRWAVLVVLLVTVLSCGLGSDEVTPDPPAPAEETTAALAEPTEPKYAASQVLIRHHGAADFPGAGRVSRTEAEAQALAFELWHEIQAGKPFEVLATERSEAPSAPRGGQLGVYRPGTMVPDFERAVAALELGEVSRPFPTPFGWHLVRRDAVVEIEVRHVIVSWQGAWRSASARTKDEARQRVDAAKQRLDKGEAFAAVAAALSEDATASHGGELGLVARGQLIPAFEDAAFALSVGGRSGVVETPYGFHVIERTR